MTISHDSDVSSQQRAGVKTLAIRLEDEQHALLTMLAQLDGLNITAAIRQAIDQWIDVKRQDPTLQARAQAALADIEQDAVNRRNALTALLGGDAPSEPPSSKKHSKTTSG
jgi:hypothetical protein